MKYDSPQQELKALGISSVRIDDKGNCNIKIGFSDEKRRWSNAKIANILEYGKHGQPPKPF